MTRCRRPPPGYCGCSPSPRPGSPTPTPPPRSPAVPSRRPGPPSTISYGWGCCAATGPSSSSTRYRAASRRCCGRCWRTGTARPRSSSPGPGCWSAPCVSSSPAARSPNPKAPRPGASSPGCRARCGSPAPTRPPPGCGPAGLRWSPPPGSPSRTANSTLWQDGWWPRWCGRWPCTRAPRRPRRSSTDSTVWCWPSRSGAICPGSGRPPCSTSPISTPGPAGPARRWPATGPHWTPGGPRRTCTPPAAPWNP